MPTLADSRYRPRVHDPLSPSGPPTQRRARPAGSRRQATRVALAALLLLVVAACNNVPGPPIGEVEQLDLVAQVPIAAAEVEFVRPAGTTVVSVVPLRAGLLVRTATVGDRVRVAWVAETAAAGAQVRFALQRPDDATQPLEVVDGRTFPSSAGDDLGAGILAWRTTSAATVLDAPLAIPAVDHAVVSVTLLPSFADHPLGDLDADGALSVRDALVLVDRLRSGGWTDFARYHGDLDADDASDATDVALLLDKLVDPSLPARLHVKPAALSFVQLDPATDRDAIVLVANQGRQPFGALNWTPPSGVAVATAGGIAGQSAALDLTLPAVARRGWLPGFLTVSGAGDEARVRVGHLVLLVAGQSNASGRGANLADWPHASDPLVRMLGNDYRWRNASEPLDDPTGQLDGVSQDSSQRYSFGTRLGELLVDASGFATYLIPAALGGTSVLAWLPAADRLDLTTLFGSANFRAQVSGALRANPIVDQAYPSEGGPVSAIVWYQGESDESASERNSYPTRTRVVMNAFDAELGAPVVYAQLASHCKEQDNVRQHATSELQRQLETGSGYAGALPRFHLVVAFDLPRSDCIHLSAFGLRLLAERIDLAVRQHVLGEDVDGTGPRILGVSHSGTRVTLRTTRVLADAALDPKLFTVFNGTPGNLDDVENYYDNLILVTAAVRDPGDPTAVRLTLASAPTQTPWLRYMAEIGFDDPTRSNNTPTRPDLWERVAPGTVRAAQGGLPLPAFGPLALPFGSP